MAHDKVFQVIALTEDDVPSAKLVKNPKNCSLEELERWLECHGIKKSGKKNELVVRVEQAISLEVPVDIKIDNGKWYSLKANKCTSSKSNLNISMPEHSWKTFPSRNLPKHFNYGHIYNYVVDDLQDHGTHVTAQNIDYCDSDFEEEDQSDSKATSKPLRKARWLLKSKFVENVQDNIENEIFMIRGHVHHSMKSEKPLKVFIAISNISGFINHASCDCRASALGRCAHVTALLLFLNDNIAENGAIVTSPCTSRPCVWNTGKKREKIPKVLHKIDYSSKKNRPNKLYNWNPRPDNLCEPDEQLVTVFLCGKQRLR